MALYAYKLYHTTTKKKADAILASGSAPRAKFVELSNLPWVIGTRGDTVIKVTIDLDYEPNSELAGVPFHPETLEWGHVALRHDHFNDCRDTYRILPTDEKNALRRKYKTPGEPAQVDRDDDE